MPRLERELDAGSSALDSLLAEVRLGVRDQRHYDQLEERADAISEQLRGAFRGARERSAALNAARTGIAA